MTWSLNAAGHTPAADGGNDWSAVEKQLHEELAAVLAKPEYGCTHSHFSGNHVTGTVHEHHSPDTEHTHDTESVREYESAGRAASETAQPDPL